MDDSMQKPVRRWLVRLLFACAATAAAATAYAAAPDASPAASLRDKYAALGAQPGTSQFERALYLDSVESARDLKGDIYALVDYPFASVGIALNNPEHWCDVMILHLNTKYCRASTSNGRTLLAVSVGK